MDRRLTPSNGCVAHLSLQGILAADRYVAGDWARLTAPIADLCARPHGPRERQLLLGDRFLVLDRDQGQAFGQTEKDGYVGWVPENALGADDPVTHWVSAPASHAYAGPTIQAPDRMALPFLSRLRVIGHADAFAETPAGFVPAAHLRAIGDWFDDPVTVACAFLGTPYLWGGNSRAGIDCSGLVQAAMLACGRACPADSDQQMTLGNAVDPAAAPCRGDLIFWKGHVALVAGRTKTPAHRDETHEIIHATGHGMITRTESLKDAIARITAAGEGPVIAHRRL